MEINILIGCILILLGFIIAFFYLIQKFPKPGLAMTVCFLIVFIGIFFIVLDRATKLVIPGIGLIELAEERAYASLEIINSLKTQMEKDAKKVSELRKHLDSMFTINSSGQVQLNREINMGNTYWGLNPGKVLTDHMNISSDSPDGTTHGMVLLQIGGYNMITATRDSDGAGDSDTPRVIINGVLELTPQSAAPTPAKEGLIYYDSSDNNLKVYNGSSWKIVTKD